MQTYKEAFEHLADRGYTIGRGPREQFGDKACWYAPDGLYEPSNRDLDAIQILMREDADMGPLVMPKKPAVH